jgi:hypothetical protein
MKRRQPTWPLGKKSAPEEFVICYPPSEDGHLTEEQKKWPVVYDEWPAGQPPQQSTPTTQEPQQQPPSN